MSRFLLIVPLLITAVLFWLYWPTDTVKVELPTSNAIADISQNLVAIETLEQNVEHKFSLKLTPKIGAVRLDQVATSCACLQCLTQPRDEIPSIDGQQIDFLLSTGGQVGDIYHKIRVRASNQNGVTEDFYVDVRYYVRAKPKFLPLSAGAIRFLNDDRFRFRGMLSVMRGEKAPTFSKELLLVASDFGNFTIDRIESDCAKTTDGIECDILNLDLSLALDQNGPEYLRLGFAKDELLRVPVEYREVNPICWELAAVFCGVREKEAVFEKVVALKNLSPLPIDIDRITTDHSGITISPISAISIPPNEAIEISIGVRLGNISGRHSGNVRVFSSCGMIPEACLEISWVVQ